MCDKENPCNDIHPTKEPTGWGVIYKYRKKITVELKTTGVR